MTPRQFDWLRIGGIVFAIGVAWATMVGAVNRKVDRDELDRYRAAQHDSLKIVADALKAQGEEDDQRFKEIDNFIGSFCIGVKDPQVRYLRQCDRRGIR